MQARPHDPLLIFKINQARKRLAGTGFGTPGLIGKPTAADVAVMSTLPGFAGIIYGV